MAALVVIFALGSALGIGYYFGRRAGSAPLSWRKRTSRAALGRLAIGLFVLMAARRMRKSFRAGRALLDMDDILRPRLVELLESVRVSAARLRSY